MAGSTPRSATGSAPLAGAGCAALAQRCGDEAGHQVVSALVGRHGRPTPSVGER